MGCRYGDTIRAGTIQDYTPLIDLDRVNFDGEPHELSYNDASIIYDRIADKMNSIGFYEKSDLHDRRSSPIECNLRLVMKRASEYDYVHPDVHVARIGAMIQNMLILHYGDLRYLNSFKKRLRSNISVLSKGYLKPYYGGYCLQDIKIRVWDNPIEVEEFLNNQLEVINFNIKTCILDRIYCKYTYNLKQSDINVMIGIVDRNVFKDIIERYHEWNSGDDVRVYEQDIRASIHLMLKEKHYPKGTINIKIAQFVDKWVIGFAAPSNISPYLVLKTLYPKIKLTEIYHSIHFLTARVYRKITKYTESEFVLKGSGKCSCGNELVYDMVNMTVSRKCLDCQMKALMGASQNIVNK